jgi:hypothetical protein
MPIQQKLQGDRLLKGDEVARGGVAAVGGLAAAIIPLLGAATVVDPILVGVCLSSFGIILMSLLLQLRNLPRMMSYLQNSLRSLLRFSFEIYSALLTRIRVWVLYYSGIDLLMPIPHTMTTIALSLLIGWGGMSLIGLALADRMIALLSLHGLFIGLALGTDHHSRRFSIRRQGRVSAITRLVMGHHETGLTPRQRTTHTYVIGQPGTGKSRAFESWIMQDIATGRGVGVIDPHGDLFNNLLGRLAERQDLWERVVIFDPLDPKWVVGFNPLEPIPNLSQERVALYMTDVAIKIWHLTPANAPRMVWLLTNSFLALSNLGLSLLDLPRFLVDVDYRESLLPRLSHDVARRYFTDEFPKSEAGVRQWVTPVLNKLGGLIFDPDMRLIFAGSSTIDFRQIMDQQKVLLVNVPKGVLGEGPSALLAAFIVAHMQKAALSRTSTAWRPPFYLYLDEFQNYTTDNIKDILSESRKYALSLTLAHQYLDQLPSDIRSAVLNTTGTIISFRVGYSDASQLAREVFPAPDFIQSINPAIHLRTSGNIPFPTINPRIEKAGWDGLARVLANLKPRQFWMRRRGSYRPIKQVSFDMPDIEITPKLSERIQNLRDSSGERFARPKTAIVQAVPEIQDFEIEITPWTE